MDTQAFLRQRRDTHALVRCASDNVRSDLIPRFVAEKTPLLDSYLSINQHHFARDVHMGQMAQADSAYRFITSEKRDPYYQTTLDELCSLRGIRGNVGGFEVVHPKFLKSLSSKLFAALVAHESFTSETLFIRYIAIADFALQLLHPVKDGTGRTGEDIMVLLGLHHQRPLTFSLTGYRASLDNSDRLLFHRHVTERIGHIEFITAFLFGIGVPAQVIYPTHILEVINALIKTYESRSQSAQIWPDGLTDVIDKLSEEIMQDLASDDPLLTQGHPYFDYASFYVKELCYLTLCLEDPDTLFDGLLKRYPLSMGCRVLDVQAALKRAYRPTPPSLGVLTDGVMALIDLKRLGLLKSSDRSLEKAVSLIEDDVFATLLDLESRSPSLEKLLERVGVPNGWDMSPKHFRTALHAKMNWTL